MPRPPMIPAALLALLALAAAGCGSHHGAAHGAVGSTSSTAATTSPPTSASSTVTPAPPSTSSTTIRNGAPVPTTTAASRTVANLSGTGSQHTSPFTVNADWQLDYHYTCPSSQKFAIAIAGVGATKADGTQAVFVVGTSGGSSLGQHGAGTYTLTVTTSCTWTVQVRD